MYSTEFEFDTLQCDPAQVARMVRQVPSTVDVALGAGLVTLTVREDDAVVHGCYCREVLRSAQRAGMVLSHLTMGADEVWHRSR